MPSDKSYNQQYWKANRKRLLEERAKRYREDKKFRTDAIARSRARVALAKLLRAAKIEMVVHAGIKEKRRTLRDLCLAANRSRDAIYWWRSTGVLPQPTYRDARGNGVYSDSQIAYVRALCNRIDNENLNIDYPTLGKILHKVWKMPWDNDELMAIVDREVLRAKADSCGTGVVKAAKEKKEDRSAWYRVGCGGREDHAEKRKTKTVRRGASGSARKYGNDSEYGQLPKSAPRSRSGPSMLTCSGRRSF